MNLGESFSWVHEQKIVFSIFWVENTFSGNANTINFKIVTYGDRYSFKWKLGKISGEG